MVVTVNIPDETARALGLTEENAARVLLENTVAQAYRDGKIGTRQLQEVLDLSWHEKETFLRRQLIYNDLSADEIEDDVDVLRRVRVEYQSEKTAA